MALSLTTSCDDAGVALQRLRLMGSLRAASEEAMTAREAATARGSVSGLVRLHLVRDQAQRMDWLPGGRGPAADCDISARRALRRMMAARGR